MGNIAFINGIVIPMDGRKRYSAVLASDVTPLDALLGIHAAVNQPYPENSVTPYEAVRMYTSDGARCGWEDDYKGKLIPGMQADMVVLEADPMTVDPRTIKDIKVLGTVRKGELVYDKGIGH